MPTFLYKNVIPNSTYTYGAVTIGPLGVSYATDQVALNNFVPGYLERYVDAVISVSNVVRPDPTPITAQEQADLRAILTSLVTVTNDDASAGTVGEYLETTVASGAAVATVTATAKSVCTLALTAGDWEVSGTINRILTGATSTAYSGAISPTADTIPPQAGGSGVGADSATIENAAFGALITGNYTTSIDSIRVKLAATATIHLVVASTFSAGTVAAFGTIRARRVR